MEALAHGVAAELDAIELRVINWRTWKCSSNFKSSSTRIIPTCCVRFTPGSVIFDLRVSSKVNEITSRLDDLGIRKSDLMLIQNVRERSEEIEDKGSRTTTSLVVESHVWGRVEDKDAIIRLLLEDSTDEVRVLIGMGGLGKTTLAQLVYNDVQVKGQFDLKAWLCVAQDFDLLRMTCRIYSSIADDGKEFKDLNNVQVSLKQKLLNKKFLIVLDDVWNESYGQWDLFRAPFLVGAPGSTIIVTTRIGSIARFMGSIKVHHLQPLSDTDSLCLIAQHALGRPNFNMRPDLKGVGEEIAKKCKGLPLAAKTIGGLLSTKVSLNQWKDVLASQAWDLPGGNSDIIPALRLSYHHLPPHLKHLFAYCSIFPKDCQFDVHELILLWMAQGFLKQSGKKHMEDLGFDYFHELLSRSFFQRSGENESSYVMHDLMNDLAQFVAGRTCTRLDDYMSKEEVYKVFEKSRHSSFVRHEYDAFKKFKAFEGVQRLRTLLPLPIYEVNFWHGFYFSIAVIDLLPKLQCLRVLSFSGYKNISKVPNSISDMKHLRYLNFSHTEITQLPESICDLHNLQTLLLRGCSNLTQLPKRIRKLSNLRHLDIADTSALKKMPSGLGMLTSLRTLPKIVIGNGNGLKLSEIKGLVDLQGRLCIDEMQNVMNVQDAAAAGLLDKQGIMELAIRWSSSADDSLGGLDSELLRLLKPQEGLLSLEIESYRGTKFPSWVGDPSFFDMVQLKLSNTRNCTSLVTWMFGLAKRVVH